MEYSPLVQKYFDRPVNLGFPEAGSSQIRGDAGSIGQGTWVAFQARVQRGRLAEIGFLAYGCPHTIAASSLATEQLTGAGVRELVNFAPDRLMEQLEIPTEKAGKILILQDALWTCFQDWETRFGDRRTTGNHGNNTDR